MLPISLVPSKVPGAPTALIERNDGSTFYLHSQYDPLDEAQFLIRDVPMTERTLYVVLGFGLGYHVRELLRRIPASSHVLVIEPEDAPLSRRFANDAAVDVDEWIRHPQLHFLAHHDPQLAPVHLADRLGALRLLSVKMVPHVPSTRTAEDFYRRLLSEIPQTLPTSIQRHLNTLDGLLENDLQNLWANLPYSWRGSSLHHVRAQWLGRPLVIVSGGPSLAGALPLLGPAQSRALIVATGTTARILSEHGVRPDAVISLDPYPTNKAHFDGWATDGVPLVYYHRIYRGVLPGYRGPLFPFTMQDEPPVPLIDQEGRLPFRRGGTVAFCALQLAHLFGASPVIFVGQDFAFSGGRTHSSGAIYNLSYDESQLPEDFLSVPGVSGQPVVTNRIYQSYLLHMQEYLLNYARRHPHVRHVNTSTVGAHVRGMEYIGLSEALAGAPLRNPDEPSVFAYAVAQRVPVPRGLRRKALRRWRQELDRMLGHEGDLGGMFAAFRRTDLYRHAAASYDDVSYLHEARGRGAAAANLSTRFRAHLIAIGETLATAGERE